MTPTVASPNAAFHAYELSLIKPRRWPPRTAIHRPHEAQLRAIAGACPNNGARPALLPDQREPLIFAQHLHAVLFSFGKF